MQFANIVHPLWIADSSVVGFSNNLGWFTCVDLYNDMSSIHMSACEYHRFYALILFRSLAMPSPTKKNLCVGTDIFGRLCVALPLTLCRMIFARDLLVLNTKVI